MAEQYANGATTSLAAGISADDLELTVLSGASFPSVGTFHCLISAESGNDFEIVTVTAVDGPVYTIERASEAYAGVQVASAHGSGAKISLVFTAASVGDRLDTPSAHASSHENGGSDEIDVTGLAGVPAVSPISVVGPYSFAFNTADLTNGSGIYLGDPIPAGRLVNVIVVADVAWDGYALLNMALGTGPIGGGATFIQTEPNNSARSLLATGVPVGAPGYGEVPTVNAISNEGAGSLWVFTTAECRIYAIIQTYGEPLGSQGEAKVYALIVTP